MFDIRGERELSQIVPRRHVCAFVARTTCLGLGVRKYKEREMHVRVMVTVFVPNDSLLVLLLIARPFQKRSRRDRVISHSCVFFGNRQYNAASALLVVSRGLPNSELTIVSLPCQP